MPRKTPPYPHFPEWTTAKFFAFIRSGLREKFNRYPAKYRALKLVETKRTVVDEKGHIVRFKEGRKAGELKTVNVYKCASCSSLFKQSEVQVDHIKPAGSLKSFDDLPSFVERLFCGVEGLQVLCSLCHDIKTKQEKNNEDRIH